VADAESKLRLLNITDSQQMVSFVLWDKTLCRVGEVAITEDVMKRLAFIAGFKDRTLAEKYLGLEYDLRQVITTAVTRESSKANAETVKVQGGSLVKQVTQEDGGWQEQLEKIQGWQMMPSSWKRVQKVWS